MTENNYDDDYKEWVHGEHPPYLDNMPGTIQIDERPEPSRLKAIAQEFIANHPGIVEFAREKGKNVVAIPTGRGKVLILGASVAAIATGAAAIIIYKHKRGSETNEDFGVDSLSE